ncbi:MAG: glycosyltransferase family 4 protein [Planctomycetota bacterium]|jgi:glycosyltransferase involved in cell wall biosynthesis
MTRNILMVSADRAVAAGEKGPFHYMLETFSRHWDRIDVIGMRPARRVQDTVFGNVHLHYATGGKLAQAGHIARTGRRLASEREYAVMTSHDYNPFYNGVGAWRIARTTGIPWVSEIHHVPGHPVAATARERVDRVLTRRWVAWASPRVAGFRVVNAGELPALLGAWGVAPEKILVLPSLYLDLDLFRPDGPRGPACDLLMVGRLVPNKGIAQVIEAVGRLARRGIGPLRMHIVGRGPLQPALARAASRLPSGAHVEFPGWLPDAESLAAAYRSARALVCASTSEGGPRVAAEAMACGTPVVGTRVGLLPELVHDRTNGMLYDGSVEDLTLALQRLLTDAEFERSLRGRLPGDLARFGRETVIAALAEGLRSAGASAGRH